MANLRKWSSSASGNATVTGGVNTINFAEGQTPGSVNNSAREMMAQVRSIYTPAEWGWVEHSATASVASQTAFKLGGNQTTNWTAGRRWRLKSGSTTRYGSVVSSSFTAETTITVTVDSGSLSASHSLAALSPIDVTANPIPTLRFDSSGNVGLGVTPSAKLDTLGPTWVRGAAAAGAVAVITPDATSGANGITIEASFLTGGNGPVKFKTAATDRLQIDNLGNVLNVSTGGLGYGTGSGGTVTQITSKATNVTLNKTNGQITMNNAALAASTSVNFGLVNSTIAATDTIVVNIQGGAASALSYIAYVASVSAGSAQICLRNHSGGSLSEAVVLNFAVIKAVTS